jgi:hypothetical protein
MGKSFQPKESFKHRCAKGLLAGWLKAQESQGEHCRLAQFSWCKSYGVFTELKFYETSHPYYFELSDGLKAPVEGKPRDKDPLTWFDPRKDRGEILFVPDITVFHQGRALFLIEVVHANPVSESKANRMQWFFRETPAFVLEIEAEEILRQTEVPRYLECKRLL